MSLDPTPKQPDLIFDVGVHKGEDTDFYLKKGFRVVGIEADPDLAAHCRSRFHEAAEAGRFTLVEGAVVDPGTLPPGESSVLFYSNLDNSVWGTTSNAWAERNERDGTRNTLKRVPALDFREVLRRHGIPHFMKIDIEGADHLCLRALLSFESRPDYLSIESEKVSFERLEIEIDLLEQLGYASFKAVQQLRVDRQRPPNPAREGRYSDQRFEIGASGLFGRELDGPWIGCKALRAQYRRIFLRYYLFGDDAFLRRFYLGQKVLALLRMVTRQPLPGWYDTHARHSSVGA